jgi:hypothetical protein
MDPKGGYGIAVVSVKSEEELKLLIAKDPANGLNSYEVYPMRGVTKLKQQFHHSIDTSRIGPKNGFHAESSLY